MFGSDYSIPVLKVDVAQSLYLMRSNLTKEFGNASQFVNWNPHITLELNTDGPIIIPPVIKLSKLGCY